MSQAGLAARPREQGARLIGLAPLGTSSGPASWESDL